MSKRRLTPRQRIALGRLKDADGSASAHWLANGTLLTTSQMTATLRQLARKGLAIPASAKFRDVVRNHHWHPSDAGLDLVNRTGEAAEGLP